MSNQTTARNTKSSFYDIHSFSRLGLAADRFNFPEFESDIHIFVGEYRNRVKKQLQADEDNTPSPFISFAAAQIHGVDIEWLLDNEERFYKNTPNKDILKLNYLSELGYITCMAFSFDGTYIVVGHITGTIQGTPNKVLYNRWYFTEEGAICALLYAPNGSYVIVAHLSGLIQMRNGMTGVVLCTLRNIQFPPKPVYALAISKTEERVCYAACLDGNVYRILIPNIAPTEDQAKRCIRADPAVGCLNTQFYGSPGMASYASPFKTHNQVISL